jgi:predicted restriction endonuclease
MEMLRPLLPAKYSPLLPDGRGSQSIYLTELPRPLALALADLIGSEVAALARGELVREAQLVIPNAEQALWEEHLRQRIEQDESLGPTEKRALVLARRGQGLFRQRVQQIESCCRVTGVNRPEHLRASHCKPWRDATNAERLDGENGLLLTPSIDHLFDRGFISFRDDGRLLVSPVAHQLSIARMGVPVDRAFDTGRFSPGQIRFLEFHRDEILLASRSRAS